ncbi:MAG: hypothetical protein LBT23_05110 [Synergistaceae bacterium]|nr:hypothetical protein [Synergistaceae bacterium]
MNKFSDAALDYEKAREHIGKYLYAMAFIGFLIFCFESRIDFGGFRLTDFYRMVVTTIVLIFASTPWFIFIKFRTDKLWILRELGLGHGDNWDGGNLLRKPMFMWLFLFVQNFLYNKIGNQNIFLVINSLLAVVSVHFLSLNLSAMMGMYRYLTARVTDDDGAKTDAGDDEILETLYKANQGNRSSCTALLVMFLYLWVIVLVFVSSIASSLKYVIPMFQFLIVCISVGSFSFFTSRFIANNMIFHHLASMNNASYTGGASRFGELMSSQMKFTKTVVIFPLLPLIYGTAFYVIYSSLSA